MADKVTVRAVRRFRDKACFKKIRRAGDVFECTAKRAAELESLGLVRPAPPDGEPEREPGGAGDAPGGREGAAGEQPEDD